MANYDQHERHSTEDRRWRQNCETVIQIWHAVQSFNAGERSMWSAENVAQNMRPFCSVRLPHLCTCVRETGGNGSVHNFEPQIVWNIIIYLCVENKLCKHAAVIIYLRQLFEWLTGDVAIWCQSFSVQQHAAAAGRVCILRYVSYCLCVCVYTRNNDWLPIQVQREFVNAVGNAQKISQTNTNDVRTVALLFYRRTNLRTENFAAKRQIELNGSASGW